MKNLKMKAARAGLDLSQQELADSLEKQLCSHFDILHIFADTDQ